MKMNRLLWLIGLNAFILSVSTIVDAENYPITYRVTNYYNTSLKVKVEVGTSHLGQFVLIPSRALTGKNPLPEKTVFCADDNRMLNYRQPQSCSLVYWNVDFKRQPMEGVNGIGQDDYYLNNNQWLLTEGYNFPRFYGHPDAQVCINNNCQPMSQHNDGLPVFFIWGKQPATFKSPNMTLNIFTDKLGDTLLNKQVLVKYLEPRYKYIDQVFKVDKSYPINIIWLARESNAKASGGLAGYYGFLANYYVEKGKLAENSEDILLKVSLHEYVHVVSHYRYATWITESLAEYYAYKSLTKGTLNDYAIKSWQELGITHPNHTTSLYKAAQKVLMGQMEYYGLFYIKGAAFWNELDNELAKHNKSLDSFIPYLSSSNKNIILPKPFTEKIEEVIGADTLNRLIINYLN